MKRKLSFLASVIALLGAWSSPALAGGSASFLLSSGVRIEIVEMPFQRESFAVLGCNNHSAACLINGHVPFGTDLELPKTFVRGITASYQGHVYSLDSSNMYDAWGGRDVEAKGDIRYFGGKCFDAIDCQFRGVFSDAAGTFVAEWKVVDGVSIRTVLTNSSDVVDLFLKHIDPPEYE
jgi:hypothetical protein